MAECEVCGEREAVAVALIEGAKLRVCRECGSGGKLVAELRAQPAPAKSAPKPAREVEVAADYAERIRKARERAHLSLEVVAERIAEKASYLDRIERGVTLPSEAAARKLEKELGIILLEETQEDRAPGARKEGGKGVTLGDLVVVKRKKK
ncbi:MAG: multiprotein-bridging factor 1 family protein [Candidatus Micrarchaeia archaeon]